MKIRSVGAEFLHADGSIDGRTDGRMERHDGANSRFSQFCEHVYNLFPTSQCTLYIKHMFYDRDDSSNIT
jgi:hypothetical protein